MAENTMGIKLPRKLEQKVQMVVFPSLINHTELHDIKHSI